MIYIDVARVSYRCFISHCIKNTLHLLLWYIWLTQTLYRWVAVKILITVLSFLSLDSSFLYNPSYYINSISYYPHIFHLCLRLTLPYVASKSFRLNCGFYYETHKIRQCPSFLAYANAAWKRSPTPKCKSHAFYIALCYVSLYITYSVITTHVILYITF
jgi:hypothetical protein